MLEALLELQKFAEGLKGCLKDDRRACDVIDLHLKLKEAEADQELCDMEKYYATH